MGIRICLSSRTACISSTFSSFSSSSSSSSTTNSHFRLTTIITSDIPTPSDLIISKVQIISLVQSKIFAVFKICYQYEFKLLGHKVFVTGKGRQVQVTRTCLSIAMSARKTKSTANSLLTVSARNWASD